MYGSLLCFLFNIRDLLIHQDLPILSISFCDLFDFLKFGINNLKGMIKNRTLYWYSNYVVRFQWLWWLFEFEDLVDGSLIFLNFIHASLSFSRIILYSGDYFFRFYSQCINLSWFFFVFDSMEIEIGDVMLPRYHHIWWEMESVNSASALFMSYVKFQKYVRLKLFQWSNISVIIIYTLPTTSWSMFNCGESVDFSLSFLWHCIIAS